MLELYVGCLIVGGGLVAASFFADHDVGTDADLSLEVDHDVDLDADHDLSVDHVDAADAMWLPVLSLRFWTFSAAFFGLTGTLLTALGRAGLTGGLGWKGALGVALGMGVFSGYVVSRLVRTLRSEKIDSNIDPATDYVGHRGAVLLKVEPGDPGTVRLNVKGVDVDLPARVDDGTPALARGAGVVVTEYREGTVTVTPFELPAEGEAPLPQRETA